MGNLFSRFKKNGAMTAAILAVAVLVALNIFLPRGETHPRAAESSAPVETAAPTVSIAPAAGKVVISEIMVKNRAVLQDEDGDFSDWIELENLSGEAVELTEWSLSDREGEAGWKLPQTSLPAGERLLLFASGKDREESLHTDFSLSEGETVFLYDAEGRLVDAVYCASGEKDQSLIRTENGGHELSLYPSPGYPNTNEGYEAWQAGLAAESPIQINEVMTANFSTLYFENLGWCDWVEIKNVSGEEVLLSDYYLSDDGDDYLKWQFPEISLKPGGLLIVCCDDSGQAAGSGTVRADFALNSASETLYLTKAGGEPVDYVFLRDIPYGGSYGRVTGEKGWFFFSNPSPGAENGSGYRKVSDTPVPLAQDGVFEDVPFVEVELQGGGEIYYTTDSSVPTVNSTRYTGPFTVDRTCVVRAISVEEGMMPSRPLTLSYIINEGHSLPVLSLVSNSSSEFNRIYSNGIKDVEMPGSLSLYEEDGSFTAPCGIKMHGETSLILPKKNMSIRFRAAYGQETVDYDAFDGGVTEFTNFVLRAGQDYYSAIIRNELCENLCLAATDNVVAQRSKYCVLYIDGEYWGIYALMEKVNEQLYASLAGVSRDSVTVIESEAPFNSDLYQDVFMFCRLNNMAETENYERFCAMMDVDSLIDWIVLEGYCANADLSYGNLRYCRSTENDGKWRLMFYDLDSTFYTGEQNFYNLLSYYSLTNRQVCGLISTLLVNEEFVDRLLTRAAQLLETTLSNESTVQEIQRLAAQIAPEVERDYARHGMTMEKWEWNIDYLINFIQESDWKQQNINNLSHIFGLTQQEREHYFGSQAVTP